MELLLVGLLLGLIILNAFATRRAVSSLEYERNQKIAQVFLVWLLPLFGALLVIYFSRRREPQYGSTDDSETGEIPGPILRFRRVEESDSD
jgi:lipid-A-disaccharide synthase-like uncharacterized protein